MSLGDARLSILLVVLGATGTFLMLPHRRGIARPRMAYRAGAALAGVGLLLFLGLFVPPSEGMAAVFFYIFSAAALIGGVLMITSRNPINSALWFASVVLSTAGLFALAGAQFLAAGTVIVYAGAIIVTFLFVIMLAQMEGKTPYDRAARTPGPATFTCFLLLWCLVYALSTVGKLPAPVPGTGETPPVAAPTLARGRELGQVYRLNKGAASATVIEQSLPRATLISDENMSDKPNVAGLGESLYTTHLVTVGLAGVLLFAALIGAVAIANPRPPARPGRPG